MIFIPANQTLRVFKVVPKNSDWLMNWHGDYRRVLYSWRGRVFREIDGTKVCLPICHIACRDCQVTDMPDQLETSRETLMYFHNNMAVSAMLTSSSARSVFSLIISNPQYSKDREPRTLFPSTHGLVTMLKICTFLGAGPGETLGFHQFCPQDLLPP